MNILKPLKFSAVIKIIGVNPFVFLPDKIIKAIFIQANKDRGKIPVKIKIGGHEFIQTLIRYSGHRRLYLNMPMRKAAKKQVGDIADFEIAFDPVKRTVPMHPKFEEALKKTKEAKSVFESLSPSRRLEILRYLSFLKTEESVDRNVLKAIKFLVGKERFAGRSKP